MAASATSGRSSKRPTNTSLASKFPNAHNAMVDIEATRRVFNWCVREGLFDAEFAKHGYERPQVPEDYCPPILQHTETA
jgi:TFIIF-interacting CTD phosphatase-like protein